MLIDGEKYACDACVRGHRVSNCQHADRALTHINKKGRPVSQCPHCRGLRKSRASHVKCECGEKPHTKGDCVYPEKGDSKCELGLGGIDNFGLTIAVDHHVCCCSHGARCICALKKEYLDPVPEIDVPEISPPPSSTDSRKPRLSTANSESSLSVKAGGHPKPAHKHNDAAQKCGLPYKIPRPHTIHGHSSIAQKSMDSLPLLRTANEGRSQKQDSIFNTQQDLRLVRSEHGSPDIRSVPNMDLFNGQIPPLNLTYSNFNNFTTSPISEEYNAQPPNTFESYFATPEEQPFYSAGLGTAVDWSALDLDNRAFSSSCSQPPSYASFDHSNVGHPGLATSSSGDVSEADDCMLHYGLPSPTKLDNNHYTTSVSDSGCAESYRLSSASSYLGLPQTSMLASTSIDSLDIDSYLPVATTSPASLDEHNSGAPNDLETLTRHGITVQDAQKFAHIGVPIDAMGDLSLPTTRDTSDPLWAVSFNEDTTFDAEAQIPEGLWRS